MDWRPSQPNGWWPKLNPSGTRVLYGNGCVWVKDFINGLEQQIAADGWHFGWKDDDTLWYGVSQPGDTAILHVVTFARLDGSYVDIVDPVDPTLVAGNTLDANDGHWVSALNGAIHGRPAGRVTFDGNIIAYGGGGVHTAGGRVLWACELAPGVWGFRLWSPALTIDISPLASANASTLSAEGYVGYGYWGPAYLRWPGGQQADVTITPWRQEGVPLAVTPPAGPTWLWAGTLDPYDQRELTVGHPLGDETCLTLVDQPALGLSVRWMEGVWRVAGCGDRGQLRVQDIAADAPRAALVDRRPPMPQPVITFALNGSVGTILQREAVYTHRWMFNRSNAPKPNDGPTYTFTTSGVADVKAQGLPADETHQRWPNPDNAAPIVFAGEQAVQVESPAPSPDFGFPGAVFTVAPSTMVQAYGYGWRHLRMDWPEWNFADVLAAGLHPLKIIKTPSDIDRIPDDFDIEIYNEPNVSSKTWAHLTPTQYASLVHAVMTRIGGRPIRAWIGAVSDTSKDGLDYLAEVARLCHDLPFHGFTLHRYPNCGNPSQPKKGFTSRAAEVVRIKQIAFGRPWGVSEWGPSPWTTGAWFWKRTHRLTPPQVAQLIREEEARWRAAGAAFCTYYPFPYDPQGGFGLLKADGTWTLYGMRP